jgi:hypothetical protein
MPKALVVPMSAGMTWPLAMGLPSTSVRLLQQVDDIVSSMHVVPIRDGTLQLIGCSTGSGHVEPQPCMEPRTSVLHADDDLIQHHSQAMAAAHCQNVAPCIMQLLTWHRSAPTFLASILISLLWAGS